MKTEIKMKWQPFHHYAAKQGFIKKGIVLSRGKENGNLKKKKFEVKITDTPLQKSWQINDPLCLIIE